jgi:hypothetical protein
LYKGPGEWKTPLKFCWTDYARHWIYIKEKYKLAYAHEELCALGEILESKYFLITTKKGKKQEDIFLIFYNSQFQ